MDAYLTARLSLPETWVQRLLTGGCVQVDGQVCQPHQNLDLGPGMIIQVAFPDNWPPHLQPTALPLSILHEDQAILVLDKPPGIAVHPARGHMDSKTLQNAVLYHCRERSGEEDVICAPSHRLDLDTSGVIVFAITRDAHRSLVSQFTARSTHKEYLALVEGEPAFDTTEVIAPLGRDPERPSRGQVLALYAGGKDARTDLHVLERGRGWALVRANPRTGRPHQVRIHLQHMGLPVIGDREYHPCPERHHAPRHALHASRLAIVHPASGKPTCFSAPLAPDMQELLDRLRSG